MYVYLVISLANDLNIEILIVSAANYLNIEIFIVSAANDLNIEIFIVSAANDAALQFSRTCCVRLLSASNCISLLLGAGGDLCSVQSMFGRVTHDDKFMS